MIVVPTEQIESNYHRVQEHIRLAAASACRPAEDVHLLVVTKGQPPEKIEAVYRAGARELGENYPEETERKISAMANNTDLRWHMIGHLQSRKARIVVRYFSMLHSLDSLDLAQKLDRLCAEADRILPVLLEVNVSGEQSKQGYSAWEQGLWPALLNEVEQICQLPQIQIQGLMTMPPLVSEPEQSRPFFKRMRSLQEYMVKMAPQIMWKDLSMGTSADYLVAVDEGATFVRVGTAILGSRPPKV